MDEQMTAGERAAYARGLEDGARRTRETIAASLATHAAGWRDRPPGDAAAIVATTLEGLAAALGGTGKMGPTSPYASPTPGLISERDRRIVADLHRFAAYPTPADALEQDGAEDAIEQARRGA